MARSDYRRSALGVGVAVVLFVGCSGTQNGALPQSQSAMSNHRAHKTSGSSGDLIYVTTRRTVYLLSYPQGDIVGSFHEGADHRHAVCSDPGDGTVFITDNNLIRKYAHGATSRSTTFHMPSGYFADGCAVEPNTSNLAVAATSSNLGGAVVLHAKASRKWKIYRSGTTSCFAATFDNDGDIYATCQGTSTREFVLKELPRGQSQMITIAVSPELRVGPFTIQWFGSYLTMEDETGGIVYRAKVHKQTARIVGSANLAGANGDYAYWIQGNSVLAWYNQASQGGNQAVAVWNYPQGGYPTNTFYGIGRKGLWDLTVSVAPSDSHIRK